MSHDPLIYSFSWGNRPTDVVLSPDGSRLYTVDDDGYLRVYSVPNSNLISVTKVGTKLGAIDVSPDGSFLIITELEPVAAYRPAGSMLHYTTTVAVYKVSTASLEVTTYQYLATEDETVFHDVAILQNGSVLLTQRGINGEFGTAQPELLDLRTGMFRSTMTYDVGVNSVLTRNASGSAVLLGEITGSDAHLRYFFSATETSRHHWGGADDVYGFNNGVQAMSPDGVLTAHYVKGSGLHVYSGAWTHLVDLTDIYPEWAEPGRVAGLAFDASGRSLYVLDTAIDKIVQIAVGSGWPVIGTFGYAGDIAGTGGGEYGNRLLVSSTSGFFTVVTDNGLSTTTNPSPAIIGTDGADALQGGLGVDHIYGLEGNDTITVTWNRDTAAGGIGTDTLVVNYSGEANREYRMTLTPRVAGGGYDGSVHDILANIHRVDFTSIERFDITTAAGNDVLMTGDGNDVIRSGAGNDTLTGGAGYDTLEGGEGIDTVDYSLETGAYAIFVNLQDQEIYGASVAFGPRRGLDSYGHYDSLSGIENVKTGAGADQIYGDGLANRLDAGAGNDFIAGGGGDDTLLAGTGDDNLYGGSGNDIFFYGAAFTPADLNDGGEGVQDMVVLQGTYAGLTLAAGSLKGVEHLSLQSGTSTAWGGPGNQLHSYSITAHKDNVAAGYQLIVNGLALVAGENLTFDGSPDTDGGRFLVYAGHGTDDLKGGSGNDIFLFQGTRWAAGDKVDGGAGADTVTFTGAGGLNRIVFGETSLVGVEAITTSRQLATDHSGTPSFEFVLANGNVASGGWLYVQGNTLGAAQSISVDGTAVTGGRLGLWGGEGRDTLVGGAQADWLYGGGNGDALTGGAGADSFLYRHVYDSFVAWPVDQILDFEVGIDKIDLSGIDTMLAPGDQGFAYIGTAAFSANGTPAQLRVEHHGGNLWAVEADLDGNGTADFAIWVTATGPQPLTGADFIP